MTVRWGVAGPGAIATSFAQGMTMVDGGEITAVASRSIERADAYADRFGIAGRYDGYEALAEDPDIDAVYVATPHAHHEATPCSSSRRASTSCARSRSPSTPARPSG